MSKPDDGGPAFARPRGQAFNEKGRTIYNVEQEGMSLRAYFAAHAPPMPADYLKDWRSTHDGECSPAVLDTNLTDLQRITVWRTAYADAQIAALR